MKQRFLSIVAGCLAAGLISGNAALVAGPLHKGYEKVKVQAANPLEEQFKAVVSKHDGDPALVAFRERLDLLDGVVDVLLSGLETSQAASLQGLLEERRPGSGQAAAGPSRAVLAAEEVLAQYQDQFAQTVGEPNVTQSELELLRRYYNVRMDAAVRYVAEQAQKIAPLSRLSEGDVAELSIVLPYLHVSDKQWSAGQIEQLPDWLRRPSTAQLLEGFSLRVRRPTSAYRWARYSSPPQAERTETALEYRSYLLLSARKLAEGRDYQSAVYCLRQMVDLADEGGDGGAATEARVELAGLYSTAGYPQQAAAIVDEALAKKPAPPAETGKIVTLRLKYLYESQQLEQVDKEFTAYRNDPNCAPYLPQMMYVTWVALRKDNKTKDADVIQNDFLKRYPEHPLAADMHFARAMSALAESDYKEASRLLELVEYKFPDSRLLPRVKEIRQRLREVAKPADQAGTK